MDFYAKLGERLRMLRTRAGLSQAALGARLGRSPSAIDRYEMGQRRVSLADLLRLSKILNVPLEAFLGGAAGRGSSTRGSPVRGSSLRVPVARAGAADAGARRPSMDRLYVEHLRLLRELDRRLGYPPFGDRSGVVREASRAYGGRRPPGRTGGRPEAAVSPQAYATTLSTARLRGWARRAGWPGTADPEVLRRFAALVIGALARTRGRERL